MEREREQGCERNGRGGLYMSGFKREPEGVSRWRVSERERGTRVGRLGARRRSSALKLLSMSVGVEIRSI